MKELITIIIAILSPKLRLVLCEIRNIPNIFPRSFENVGPAACWDAIDADSRARTTT